MEPRVAKRVKKFLIATAVGCIVFGGALALHFSGLFEIAELKTLDYRFQQYANPRAASPDIVLIAIDEASLETFGRWPWPRDRHGFMVQYLKQAGARAIVFDVLFLEPDEASEEFDAAFAEAAATAGNVFLPYQLQTQPSEAPPVPLMPALTVITTPDSSIADNPQKYHGLKLPIPSLAQAARGLGFINLTADVDGTNRRIPLLAQISLFPQPVMHLTTSVARYAMGTNAPVTVRSHTIAIPPTAIPVTKDGSLLLNWHGTLAQKVYPAYSAGAVLKASARSTAPRALRKPAPCARYELPLYVSAVYCRIALTAFGVSDGLACSISATVPATTGAAWLVPVKLRYGCGGAVDTPGSR